MGTSEPRRISFPQMSKVHDALVEQGVTPPALQLLLRMGRFSDLGEAVVAGTIPGRDEFRRFLGLGPVDPVELVLSSGLVAPAPIEEAPLDTTILVDRSIPPVYPDWKIEVMHPELESLGPTEYDIARVELWLHDGQKSGKSMKGTVIYQYLKDANML